MKNERLKNGKFYHVYNRGNNRRDLFKEASDYEHFLKLYDKFISPIAETYAWVLMPNHFHLMVKIKENIVYKYSREDSKSKSDSENWFKEHKWETVPVAGIMSIEKSKIPAPHKHFAHLFNAYARYFNTYYESSGSLFERPFSRKFVDTKSYRKNLILYIHDNSVHHGFCNHPLEYPWSSYISFLSDKSTRIMRKEVIEMFGNRKSFKTSHHEKQDIQIIERWLNLDTVDYVVEGTKNNENKI